MSCCQLATNRCCARNATSCSSSNTSSSGVPVFVFRTFFVFTVWSLWYVVDSHLCHVTVPPVWASSNGFNLSRSWPTPQSLQVRCVQAGLAYRPPSSGGHKYLASLLARASSTVVVLDYSICKINTAHVSIVISNATWRCNVDATPFTTFSLALDSYVRGRDQSVMFWCRYCVQEVHRLTIDQHLCKNLWFRSQHVITTLTSSVISL